MTFRSPFHPGPIFASSLIALFALASQSAAVEPKAAQIQPAAAAEAGNAADNATRLPEVTVTAQKEPASAQDVPVSVTAVTADTIKDANIQVVKQAAVYAPNVFINEFTARKLSNPYFRGVGSSPANPGVTTYLDGVPQLNANSSNIEFVDVDQVEFIRGPQGALYGRNTLGGLINVTSRAPSLNAWTGGAEASYGSYNFHDFRMNLSGPVVADQVGMSLAGGYSARDGYTKNSFTGNNLDQREAWFGKFQIQLKATENYDARLLFFAEHDRDGDYALGDLNAIRANPRRVSHDYEGYTHRDIYAPTLLQTITLDAMQITSITGAVWWRTTDATDLDYTSSPLATRWNSEKEHQFTQELRFSSLKDQPLALCDNLKLAWQTGVFTFYQDYNQSTANDVSTSYPFGSFSLPIQVNDQSNAAIKNWGTGVYGQTTLTAWDQLDLILGLRYDYEMNKADLNSLTSIKSSLMALPSSGSLYDLSADSSAVSPQLGLAWHVTKDQMLYGKVTRGFKAGGFNSIAPAGDERYGEEKSWCYEVGAKSEWLDGKLRANAALYYIDWSDLQLNEPLLTSPGRFFIGNVGSANSKGVELEVNYRPVKGWDLFGSVGYTDARFGSGSLSEGVDVSGHKLPYAPDYTANVGTQYAWDLNSRFTLYTRAQVTFYGNFKYDATNLAAQGNYSIADFRVGLRSKNWFAEGWVANAFNTHYVPIAFEYSKTYAPSGYIGESGAPMTVGIRTGVSF